MTSSLCQWGIFLMCACLYLQGYVCVCAYKATGQPLVHLQKHHPLPLLYDILLPWSSSIRLDRQKTLRILLSPPLEQWYCKHACPQSGSLNGFWVSNSSLHSKNFTDWTIFPVPSTMLTELSRLPPELGYFSEACSYGDILFMFYK